MNVCESKGMLGFSMACHTMHLLNDLIQHRKRSPIAMVQPSPGSEAKEKVSALSVTGRMKGNCPNSTTLHGVIMLFMHLSIFTKLNVAMGVKREAMTQK